MPYVHSIRVRYGECDMQRVIEGTVDVEPRFSANLTYVSVVPRANTPIRIPDRVRELLG